MGYSVPTVRSIDLTPKRDRYLSVVSAEDDRSNLSTSTFPAGASHEIRKPLDTIVGLVHLMNMGRLEDERLLLHLESVKSKNSQPDMLVTVSFGVADGRARENVDALIGRVDKMLYEAKAAGRHQVRGDSGQDLSSIMDSLPID